MLGHLTHEAQVPPLAALLRGSALPFIIFTELYYLVWQRLGAPQADRVIGSVKAWHRPILWPTEDTLLVAGRLKATYHLGMADSYVAACAVERRVTLVTKDPDVRALHSELQLLYIR